MTLLVKQGTIIAPGTTGPVSYTDIGFQPKYGLFYANKLTSTGFGINRNFSFGIAAEDTTCRGITHTAGDAQTAANTTGRRHHNDILCLIDCAGGIVTPTTVGDLTSWDSLGFTINWINVNDGLIVLNYLVVGGDEITDTWCGTILSPTVTGSVAYTDPAFRPDLLVTATTGEQNTVPGSFTQCRIAIGMATGPSAQQSLTVHDADLIPTQVASMMNAKVIQVENLGSTKHQADLTSIDSLGWTLDWQVVNATVTPIFVLAVKGGSYYVGRDTQKTSTGLQSKSDMPFSPKGLLFMGIDRDDSDTKSVTLSKLSMGGTDGTSQSAIWGESTDNVSTTDCNSYRATDGVIVHGSNSSTLDAKAAIDSLDPNGYTLDWLSADAVARQSIVLGIGSPSAPITDEAPLRQGLTPLRWR